MCDFESGGRHSQSRLHNPSLPVRDGPMDGSPVPAGLPNERPAPITKVRGAMGSGMGGLRVPPSLCFSLPSLSDELTG